MTAFALSPLPSHASSDRVDYEVDRWRDSGDVISNAVALAIAGWYSGPGRANMPFTILAQQGKGMTGVLGEAIMVERALHMGRDARELDALDAWVAEWEDL